MPDPTALVELIPFSALTRQQAQRLENAVSRYGNPERVFQRKVEALAQLLDCTEEEATHVLLHSL
jgi:hypothetical protein